MNWTLSQLRAFCAVRDLGTMTAAAAHLGYTTGAVSQQIAALERVVGEELFVRIGRELVITDTGVSLLRHAKAIVESESRAVESISRETNRSVVVRIGAFGSVALFAIPRMLEIARTLGQPLSIRVFEIKLDEMPDAVLSGQIDIALSVDYPDAPAPPYRGLRVEELHTEAFQLILPTAALPSIGTTEALLRYCNETDWILPPPHQPFGKAILLALARAGIQPRVRHSLEDTALSLALTESGVGVTTATPLMLALRPTTAIPRSYPVDVTRTIVALTLPTSEYRDSIMLAIRALQEAFRGT